MYDVFVGLYPTGLLTTLVHYKREHIRIMSRLGEASGPLLDPEQEQWVQVAVDLLKAEGRGPFHLIRDAKLECQIMLSLHDRAALKMAQIDIPRSAGRFKEMFINDK